MPVTYSEAAEVRRVADELIDNYHERLKDQRVEFVFRSEEAKTNGAPVLGSARKVSGINAYLARRLDKTIKPVPGEDIDALRCEPFFLLTVARSLWDTMDSERRSALVDHLLSRCQTASSENGIRLFCAGPPAEFPDVLARHGMWRKDLVDLVRAAGPQQMDFFHIVATDDDDETDGEGEE
jgi:hypothetical protein